MEVLQMLSSELQTAASIPLQPCAVVGMLSDAAMAVSALIVAVLAILGFDAWKRRVRHQAASKVLQLGKRFANEIQRSRHPMGSSAESEGRERQHAETPEEAAALDQRYAHMRRLEPSATTLRDMQQASWEAEVALKTDLESCVKAFIAVHNKLSLAVEKRYLVSKGLQLTPDEHKEILTTLYGPMPQGDRITELLERAQRALERALKRYI